jgi:hypothetical protein
LKVIMTKIDQSLIGLVLCLLGMPLAQGEVLVNSSQQVVSINEAMTAVIAASDPIPADQVPTVGTFYSAKYSGGGPPMPGAMGFAVWDLGNGNYLVDDLDEDRVGAVSMSSFGMSAMLASSGPPSPGGGGGTNSGGVVTNSFVYTRLTNGVWLEVSSVSNGVVFGNLHRATNQVYAILGCSNLTENVWSPEAVVFPGTDTNSVAFSLDTFERPALFLRAHDWTGDTHGANNVPDWWFWYYFGTTNLTDDTIDSQWQTLGNDYTNNWVPFNSLSFSVNMTNTHCSGAIQAQLNITSGIPGYFACVFDDANYASNASWQPFHGTNLTVSLPAEGWHAVWIGLRGHADPPSSAVWLCKQVKVDRTPPLVFVTSPTNVNVTTSLLQVQGCSDESLSSISYDLTNASGLVTNQQILLLNHFYDTNTQDFATHTWQAFDVALVNGMNNITFRATDLAGNTTITNLSITLDCARKTNVPSIALIWPQDRMKVCGTNFTCNGVISDPTATVTAQTIDASGTTNLLNAHVGRDGTFYIPELPLNSGTNNWMLTAVDTASNVTTISFSVIKGDIGLKIDPISPTQARVTGSILVSTYTVWVNGKKASLNSAPNLDGSYSWEANDVPIPRNASLVQVTAIPNSDNGGYGTWGNGGAQ